MAFHISSTAIPIAIAIVFVFAVFPGVEAAPLMSEEGIQLARCYSECAAQYSGCPPSAEDCIMANEKCSRNCDDFKDQALLATAEPEADMESTAEPEAEDKEEKFVLSGFLSSIGVGLGLLPGQHGGPLN